MLHLDLLVIKDLICSLFEESEVDPIFTSMNCGTPVTGVNPFTGNEDFNNLEPGTYTFTVRACVDVNEEPDEEPTILQVTPPICDETPASITWTIEEDDNGGGGGNNGGGGGNNGGGGGNNGGGGGGGAGGGGAGAGGGGAGAGGGGAGAGGGGAGAGGGGAGAGGGGGGAGGAGGGGAGAGGGGAGAGGGGAGAGGNNDPSPTAGPSNVPNEAGGTPDSGITPSGSGPTGASPFSPMTPAAIDPSIPRDISVYVQQFKNPGPISAKYGKQVGNQCLLQLDRDLLLNPENMSQIRDQILSQENMSKIFSKDNSLVTLDGQLDIYGEISLPNTPSSNQTIILLILHWTRNYPLLLTVQLN